MTGTFCRYIVVLAHPVENMASMSDADIQNEIQGHLSQTFAILGQPLHRIGHTHHPAMQIRRRRRRAAFVADNRLGIHTPVAVPLSGHDEAMALVDAIRPLCCPHYRLSINLLADWEQREEPLDLLV